MSSLHTQYPFTQDLKFVVTGFKNRFQQLYHEKYLLGAVVKCLSLMSQEVFFTLLMTKNQNGLNMIAALIEDNSGYLNEMMTRLSEMDVSLIFQILTKATSCNQNLLCIAIRSNEQLVEKLLTWIVTHQPDAVPLLMTEGFNPLSFALIQNKQKAVEVLLEVLDQKLDPESGPWHDFFTSKTPDGNHVLQNILLHAPEYLMEGLNLLTRFDSAYQVRALSSRNQAGDNSLMMAIYVYHQQPVSVEAFLNYLNSQPACLNVQWFNAICSNKENLLLKAAKRPATLFSLIRQLFINFSEFERFTIVYAMNPKDLVINPILLDLFEDLNPKDVLKICQRTDKTTGQNLLLQLATAGTLPIFQKFIVQHPYLFDLLFSSVDHQKQTILMLSLNDENLYNFLFQILPSLPLKQQEEVLSHQSTNQLSIFMQTFQIDGQRLGFNGYEKTLFIHILGMFNQVKVLSIPLMMMLFKNYFTHPDRFLRFLKILDYFFNYCPDFKGALEPMIHFLLMSQVELNSFELAPIELLTYVSVSFQAFYKTILVQIIDSKFEGLIIRSQETLITLYKLRFSLIDYAKPEPSHQWLVHLMSRQANSCLELLNDLASRDVNVLIIALQYFPDLGIELAKKLFLEPGFEAFCFQSNSTGKCVYTYLLKLGCTEIVLNKQPFLSSVRHRYPVLAEMVSDRRLAEGLNQLFFSDVFSLEEKLEILGFNLFVYTHHEKSCINASLLEFLLQQFNRLPMLSQAGFSSLFNPSTVFGTYPSFYYLMTYSFNSRLSNLELFLLFLQKQQKIDMLVMRFGLNSVMHALSGVSEENYQIVMTLLKENFNFPELLKDICQHTDLVMVTMKKARNVDCKRLIQEMIDTLPALLVWEAFVRLDGKKTCGVHYLVQREELQSVFFDYLSSNGVEFRHDLRDILSKLTQFDRTKGAAVLNICHYLSAEDQLTFFSNWDFLAKYASKYFDLRILPSLMEKIFQFERPVTELIIANFSWKSLCIQSQTSLKSLNAMLTWLASQAVEIRYLLLQKGALAEVIKSRCAITGLDNLLYLIKTLPLHLQKNLLDEELVSLQAQAIVDEGKQEKLLAYQVELDVMLAQSQRNGFFASATACDASQTNGPSPF